MPESSQYSDIAGFTIFPEDVLEEVFSFMQDLDDKKASLFACSLASRTWRVLTLKWRFRCISVSIRHLRHPEYNLTDFLKANPSICQAIHEVKFSFKATLYTARRVPIGSELVGLMMLLPAIKKLTIPGHCLNEAYFDGPRVLHDDAGCLIQRPPLYVVLASSSNYPALPLFSPSGLYRFVRTIGMVDTLTIEEGRARVISSLDSDQDSEPDSVHLPVLQLRSLVLGAQIVFPNPRGAPQRCQPWPRDYFLLTLEIYYNITSSGLFSMMRSRMP